MPLDSSDFSRMLKRVVSVFDRKRDQFYVASKSYADMHDGQKEYTVTKFDNEAKARDFIASMHKEFYVEALSENGADYRCNVQNDFPIENSLNNIDLKKQDIGQGFLAEVPSNEYRDAILSVHSLQSPFKCKFPNLDQASLDKFCSFIDDLVKINYYASEQKTREALDASETGSVQFLDQAADFFASVALLYMTITRKMEGFDTKEFPKAMFNNFSTVELDQVNPEILSEFTKVAETKTKDDPKKLKDYFKDFIYRLIIINTLFQKKLEAKD